MKIRTEQLFDLGQSVWLDFIRRSHLQSGEFDRMVREHGVVGVTSNPTIFAQALREGDEYDETLREHVQRGLVGPGLFEALAVEDIQDACDRLSAVAIRTGGRDGRVSIEVSPRLAHHTDGTLEEARRLQRSVSRDNLMVKVPATAEGLPAITALTAEGLNINITLIFSLARYRQVIDAWLTGIEQRVERGLPVDRIFSVASFFVSRVDSKVDRAIEQAAARLPEGSPERHELNGFLGRSAIANARLAYALFEETFGSPRFEKLHERGANPQRPLWASTSTKNPAYPDTVYVDQLIGPHTVNTMPPATLDAFNDHGTVKLTIRDDLDEARRLMDRLPKLGVPVQELIDQLEPEGVAAFAKSYDELLDALDKRRAAMAAGHAR